MPTKSLSDYFHLDFIHAIRDPLWQNILYPENFLPILNSTEFRKLAGIRQLGPTYLVYPGAVHTRLNHSLGVYHLGKKLLQTLIAKDFHNLFDMQGVKAFLCACLLHDLGHFPFAHSLKELPLEDHETLTGKIILQGELYDIIKKNLDINPERVAAIIDQKITDRDTQTLFYRKLLSGVLDPDKLDYLNRDAYFCGVSYGAQDLDFVFQNLRAQQDLGLVLEEPAVLAVENLLFSKYLMYRSVYWHKTVRIATAMIKKAVHTGLGHGTMQPEELYGLQDHEFETRFSPEKNPVFKLIQRVKNRNLFNCAGEFDFDINFAPLENLELRAEYEQNLSFELFGEKNRVIIDVPENIKFEIDISVQKTDGSISTEIETVFDRNTVTRFVQTIRKVRILIDDAPLAAQKTMIHAWKRQNFG